MAKEHTVMDTIKCPHCRKNNYASHIDKHDGAWYRFRHCHSCGHQGNLVLLTDTLFLRLVKAMYDSGREYEGLLLRHRHRGIGGWIREKCVHCQSHGDEEAMLGYCCGQRLLTILVSGKVLAPHFQRRTYADSQLAILDRQLFDDLDQDMETLSPPSRLVYKFDIKDLVYTGRQFSHNNKSGTD